jgi:hypothetical protein
MKLTITKAEIDALIRDSFNLPSDAEIEIVNSEANHDDWISIHRPTASTL